MPATFRVAWIFLIVLGGVALPGRVPAVGIQKLGIDTEPVRPVLAQPGLGGAFGPLSLGDSRDRVLRELSRLPGAICLEDDCSRVQLELDGTTVVVGFDFAGGRLSKAMAVSAPHGPGAVSARVWGDWRVFLELARQTHGTPASEEPRFPDLRTLEAPWGTHVWEKPDGSSVTLGIVPVDAEGGRAFSAILLVKRRGPSGDPVLAALAP